MNIQSRFIVFPLPWLAGWLSVVSYAAAGEQWTGEPSHLSTSQAISFSFSSPALDEEDALDDLNFSR